MNGISSGGVGWRFVLSLCFICLLVIANVGADDSTCEGAACNGDSGSSSAPKVSDSTAAPVSTAAPLSSSGTAAPLPSSSSSSSSGSSSSSISSTVPTEPPASSHHTAVSGSDSHVTEHSSRSSSNGPAHTSSSSAGDSASRHGEHSSTAQTGSHSSSSSSSSTHLGPVQPSKAGSSSSSSSSSSRGGAHHSSSLASPGSSSSSSSAAVTDAPTWRPTTGPTVKPDSGGSKWWIGLVVALVVVALLAAGALLFYYYGLGGSFAFLGRPCASAKEGEPADKVDNPLATAEETTGREVVVGGASGPSTPMPCVAEMPAVPVRQPGDPAHINRSNNRPHTVDGVVPWTGRPPLLRGPQPACMVPTITSSGKVLPRSERVLPGPDLFETPLASSEQPLPPVELTKRQIRQNKWRARLKMKPFERQEFPAPPRWYENLADARWLPDDPAISEFGSDNDDVDKISPVSSNGAMPDKTPTGEVETKVAVAPQPMPSSQPPPGASPVPMAVAQPRMPPTQPMQPYPRAAGQPYVNTVQRPQRQVLPTGPVMAVGPASNFGPSGQPRPSSTSTTGTHGSAPQDFARRLPGGSASSSQPARRRFDVSTERTGSGHLSGSQNEEDYVQVRLGGNAAANATEREPGSAPS